MIERMYKKAILWKIIKQQFVGSIIRNETFLTYVLQTDSIKTQIK